MSKATDDLIARIEGVTVALGGVKVKLSPPPPPAAPPDVPPPAPAQVTQEDFAFAKKVVAELKGLAETLEGELAKESKVPGAEAPEEHKSLRGSRT